MVIRFDKDYLRELFEEGKCRDKKYRFQPVVVKNYAKCILFLDKADRIEDLYAHNSLHYDMLIGDKAGVSSIRINRQYRLEFIVSTTQDEPVITICTITDITNHYK